MTKGIWKTGVLAAAVTLSLAFAIFRGAEWFEGANEELAADEQPGAAAAGFTGATGAGTLARIMPQIVAGSYDGGLTRYKTTLEVVNTGSAPIAVSGAFYNTDGTASTDLKTTNLAAVPTVTSTLASTAVPAKGILLITAENMATGKTGWARIVASGSAAVSAYVELRDAATGILYNRIGVASSPADMASFVIPWIRNAAAGLDTGFAIVNTGASDANITGTVRDESGTVLAAQTISLPAGNHTATFAGQLFSSAGCSPCLTSEVPGQASGPSYGSMTFVSTSAQFAAMGLSIEGAALSTAPVERMR